MMWYSAGGTPWWGWLLMCVGMLAFWAVVIGAIWYAVAHAMTGERPRAGGRSAQQILDERFARGDIDADEYATRRATLGVAAPRDRTAATSGATRPLD